MKENQIRGFLTEFTTREDGEQPVIEGYFSVFNTTYDMGYGMSESVAPGAFTKSISGPFSHWPPRAVLSPKGTAQ